MELKGITKSYRQGGLFGSKREISVLKGIDLNIEPGRCLGLLGASGCGKSTLGRLALGLEKPDKGGVFYKGQDLAQLSKEEKTLWRRNCQVVFQNSHGAVNPRYEAWRIVSEPLLNYGWVKEKLKPKAEELLASVGLDSTALFKKPHQFSGGELQRICVARALALEPEFIVLDEPVSSLDMLNQSLVLELLSNLKIRSGTAFLFISHDLRVILKMSDSLAVMKGGRITSFSDEISKLEDPNIPVDPTLRTLASAVLEAEPK
jgi:nickel transport system ATP-binding protein